MPVALKQARPTDGRPQASPERLLRAVGFAGQNSLDDCYVAVCEVANFLVREFDDGPQLSVVPNWFVALRHHVRLDGCEPDRIIGQKLAKVPLCLSRVAGATAGDKIAKAMLAEGLFVDGHDMIHDQFTVGTAIGTSAIERVHDCLPLQRVELLIAEAAKNVSHQVILCVTDGVSLVSPSRSTDGIVGRRVLIRCVLVGKICGKPFAGQVALQKGKALTGRRIEPLARHAHGDAMNHIFVRPIPDPISCPYLGHLTAERTLMSKVSFEYRGSCRRANSSGSVSSQYLKTSGTLLWTI